MSCSTTSTTDSSLVCTPCGFSGIPDPANEPLASALENFVEAFFGSVTKTLVDGQVAWTLPCDLATGLESNPRAEGEGIACYFLRLITEGATTLDGGVMLLPDLIASPTANPTKGQLYVKNGALTYMSPAGTETTVAPA